MFSIFCLRCLSLFFLFIALFMLFGIIITAISGTFEIIFLYMFLLTFIIGFLCLYGSYKLDKYLTKLENDHLNIHTNV